MATGGGGMARVGGRFWEERRRNDTRCLTIYQLPTLFPTYYHKVPLFPTNYVCFFLKNFSTVKWPLRC